MWHSPVFVGGLFVAAFLASRRQGREWAFLSSAALMVVATTLGVFGGYMAVQSVAGETKRAEVGALLSLTRARLRGLEKRLDLVVRSGGAELGIELSDLAITLTGDSLAELVGYTPVEALGN
ncbi:MAG: hypothetical protein ACI9SE_002899 [Neolewinella sp.]|jgi:hypothetical protein